MKKHKQLARKSIRELITDYLLIQKDFQNSDVIIIPVTKTELAKCFQVHRTSVSREFRRMEQDKLIKIFLDKKTIQLLNNLMY